MGKGEEGAWIEQQATAAAGKNHIGLINQAEILHRGSWKNDHFYVTWGFYDWNENVFRENPGDSDTVSPA